MDVLSEEGFAALRSAVTVARERQLQTVVALRRALVGLGHHVEDVEEALRCWGGYLVEQRRAGTGP